MPTLLKKLRISYFIFWGTLKRHRRNAAWLILLSLVSLIGLALIAKYLLFTKDSNFVEGMVGQYQGASLPKPVEGLVSIGLTEIDQSGLPQPAAAKSWEVKDQGKRFVFTLRDDLYWHDGTKFTAHDLNYLFEGVETRVDSDTQIEFILKNPYAPFPTVLAKSLLKGDKLLGLGDYRISKLEKSQDIITEVTLTQRTDGHSLGQASNTPRTLRFRFYPTQADMITAYQLGELKAMYGFFDSSPLRNWRNFRLITKPTYTSVITAYFNNRDDLLKEKTVRQALLFAIPPDIFPGIDATSPLPPTSWAFNANVKQYVYDTSHAIELVKKALGGSQASLTITTAQAYAPIANQLSHAWNKLGFTTGVTVSDTVPEKYQVLLIRQELPADPDQYALWHSLQHQTNYAHYTKDRIDKFLEDGRKIQNTEERAKIYADFQRFLVEDAPAAFLYYPDETLLVNKRFDTLFYRALNGFD